MTRNDKKEDFPDFGGNIVDFERISRRNKVETFSATDTRTNKRIFIKILESGTEIGSPEAQVFLKEKMLLQKLNDKYEDDPFLPILEDGFIENRLYFIQPFLQGWTLSEAMLKRPLFNGSATLRFIEKCLRVIQLVHDIGYVHGDPSPENIFVVTDESVSENGSLPENYKIKIIDFGSAQKMYSKELHVTPIVSAKPPYVAPEILTEGGKAFTPGFDLYAFGIILYEMLAGKRPYEANSFSDVLVVAEQQIAPLPELLEIPKPVELFLYKMLSRDPKQRLNSVQMCLNDLQIIFDTYRWLDRKDPPTIPGFDYNRGTREDAHRANVKIPVDPSEGNDRPVSDTAILQSDEIEEKKEDRRNELTTVIAVPISASKGKEELVNFSVFGPSVVSPNSSFILNVWAYGSEQREAMIERAVTREGIDERGSRGGVKLPGKTELTIYLQLDEFEIKDPFQPIYWNGEITNIGFIVSAPINLGQGFYIGKVHILSNGLLISKMVFELSVKPATDITEEKSLKEAKSYLTQVNSAFASYSSEDREQVLMRVQGMSHAGLDVFMDVLSLRSGQKWQSEIFDRIRKSDLFFLFWSKNASNSDWVKREWQFALEMKGIDFIHPIPLISPSEMPPPEELASLHFNDLFMICMGPQPQ